MSTPRTHPSLVILAVLAAALATAARAQMCGSQAGNATCADCLCCSKHGFCGSTSEYCGDGCQSQCYGCGPGPVCGSQAGNATCANCLCCNQHGFCGSTAEYCEAGCQSKCSGCAPVPPGAPPPPAVPPPPSPPAVPPPPSPPAGPGVGSILSRDLFELLLLNRNDGRCPASGFYTYDAFLEAAADFPAFGGTTDGLSTETRKREVAAFLGQTSHETTGGSGWPDAPDGPFTWGYCFKEEVEKSVYCDTTNTEWPCAPGKRYYGRGPIQLSWNYNYGQARRALGLDLLGNPDLVAMDPVLAFKTALWFWMTPQWNKPSSHAVITGQWNATAEDTAAGRVPGYGVITNIINGGLECGIGPDPRVADRIGFYQRYCDILGVGAGDNVDCDNQRPFNSGVSAGLAAQ